ncbi:MAG: ATP-grasp fold amidoligase family protein [Bacteroidales bacterium]|nr:ATP-grasp fold amidoligase family protein [Bacteroidales bacterium]
MSPKLSAELSYWKVFRSSVNWQNPKNLIEKIFWLQFNTDTKIWTNCADKYLVRDYVKKCGFEDALPKLYFKWDSAKDIDFDKLPNRYILKTNNGCGMNIIVENNSKINKKKTIRKLDKWLNEPFGYFAAQIHYLRIKPSIIAEELLENNDTYSSSLVDYKIWCFNGVPECILVVFDRKGSNYLLSLYDLNWKNISKENFNPNYKYCSYKDIPKPKSLAKMIELAKILSKEIPQVRVDFYDIDGKPYFGEMTFTSGFGVFSEDYYNYLGSKIDLSKIKRTQK